MEGKNMEKLQRFSIRKLSIGAVSCMIGTVTFLGYSNNVQAAEKPQTVETTKSENEIKPENTQESKPTEEAKGNTQNEAVDKNVARSQAKNSAVVNTSDQHKSEDSSVVASTSERNQLQTSQDSSIKVKENNLNTDKSDTPKAELVVQPKINATSTDAKLNGTSSAAAEPNATSKEVKPNNADSAISTKIKLQSIKLAKPVNARVFTESKVATDNQFNFDDWTTETDDTYLNITGYKGDNSKQIVVPNGADFAKAGKNDKNLQVEIDKNTLADLIVDGVAPKLSNTDGQKIVAKGNDWFATFWEKDLHDISGLANLDTSNVTNMREMFYGNQISDLSPLSNWNTSKVTDMDSMFDGNQISDLSPLTNWNTSNVTDMDSMFDGNQISDLSPLANWDTSKVTDMSRMFYYNQISDLSPLAGWNTNNVTDMHEMFHGNEISDLRPLSNWDTSKVTNMYGMFDHNQIRDLNPLANWKTGNVTDMSDMFSENQITDLSPLANWNTDKVTNMDKMFYPDPLNSTINSQSILNKFHAAAYKLDNVGALASHSENKTFNDSSQILLDKNVITEKDSATLIFKANGLAGNTYQIKIYNPNKSINIQAAVLPTALGTTDTSYQNGYTIITNKFINNGSVNQSISIAPKFRYPDMPYFAQYESTSGLITVIKDKEDLGSINIAYQNVADISKSVSAPYIGNKPYINHTQSTFYFQPRVDYAKNAQYSFIKSAGLTITVPDDVTIDPNTFIDIVNGKILQATKIANNQYQVVLNNTTDRIAVKGLINVPANKLTNGTAHLSGFGMKYAVNTYNDKAAPLVATGTSKELSVIPDLTSHHGNLINIHQSKWAFDRNGNKVDDYALQGFTNTFGYVHLESAVSTQVTNGVETFNMPAGVNITEFKLNFNNNVIDHVDYIYTDDSRQTASSLDATPKAIRQMKVYFKNGIQSDLLRDIDSYYSKIKLSFDTAYPDGTPIKNFDTFKITSSFSCNELGSINNIDVAQIMLAPTQKLTDQMLTDTSQAESNTAPNASNNFINATIYNDDLQHQGHLTNPIFYFKYNDLMVPDLSEISASYYNQNKDLGSIGLTNIDNNKIHSSIITDDAGQKFIKVKVDGEYYYQVDDKYYNEGSSNYKSGFNVKIPIINMPDALTATKDWSWYILNNSDEAKTESTIQNPSQGNKLLPTTVDGNTLSVGGTGTWQIITAEGFTSGTETQGNLNGGPGLASTQDDHHHQDPTHFNIYNSIINATDEAKSNLVSVANLPSTQDGKSQFDVHMTGKASLVNVMTGQPYDATITYSYGTGDNNFITGDQVTDWSKVKSIKVVPNGGVSSMTSLRLVVPVEDKTVYDDVGKTIYMSTMIYGEDKTNTNYTTKDGFAVPEKSTILPIIIKPGDMASAKLTVQGQATVHTLIHYKDANGKDVYVKLADKDKTYNELQDTMKRSDYLQSDSDLTIADRGLLPTGMIIDYSNPTIHNSNNTYAADYANGVAAFDKTAKYDFDGDQVIFEGAMPEIVTKTHQAKETIHYVYRDGRTAKPDKVLTSITLKQTGSKNPFTGEITWNSPATDTLNSVDSPEITGYIADKSTVPSYTVTMDSPDKEVTVTYDADNETADFTYFDDTTNSTLKVVNKSGKSNTSIGYTTTDEINNYEKQGYTLVSDDTDGRNLNFNSLPSIDQHYTIHLKHNIENLTRNDTVTRTIHYLYDNGNTAQPDKTQTVSFNETGTKDDVTGKTTWSNDNAQSVDSVDTPNIVGYTPDKSSIEGQSFKFGDKDVEVTVTYHANSQTATITYIDDTTKNNLDSKETSGKFGQAITFTTAPTDEIASYKKQGYKLVSNDFNDNKYQADNSKNVFYVHFVHDTKKVSRNDDVNMTVHYVMDDGSVAPSDNKQTVNFTENGIQDLVTQTITWTPADNQTLNNVTSPVLTGYTADIKTANGKIVNFGDPDINVTVTYHANAQTAKITYIDDTTKNNLDSKDASGKFGQVITFTTAPSDEIANYEKQGYVLVSNSFNNNKYQADNNNNVFYVHFIHGTKKVNREHSASFTVHYIYNDNKQAKPDHEQTLSFTENGIQDLVTQKITWTPADSQKFDDAITPVVTGYTPDQDKVIGQTANFETGNREVTVTYLPNVQLGHINYIDDNTGKTLTRDDFSGRTNEHEDYTAIDRIQEFENKGYVFVSSDYPDGGFNFDDNDQQDQVFNVHLKHGIVTVTSKNPQIPNTTIDPDPHSPKYPDDISNTNSDVKRTIDYKFKDGKIAQPTVNDSLHFERTVVIDKVTGDVLSDTWTPSQDFNDIQTPAIQGYTPDRAVVSDKNIGHDHQNIIEHVVYSPDTQHMTITYVDDTTHETLKQDKLDGTSDQDANYTTSDTIKKYIDSHYKLVSDSTNGKDLIFDHDDNADQTYEVHFVHNTHTINQTTSPKQTVHYIYADDLARQGKAADDNVQQLSFKRDGYNDEVTGIDHWNAWIPANSQYKAVDSPVVQGYTPDKSVIEKSTVNPTDKDTEITVVYNADKQAAQVIYIDKTTNTTLTSDNLSGQSDKDSGYNTKDTIGKYQSQHYVLTGDETNGDNVIFDHDDKQDQTYYVYFVHGTQNVSRQDTVTSTIDYKFEDGQIARPTVTQTKQFTEDGVKDLVTGKIVWDEAESQKFDDIATKSIVGYTPDKDNVTGSTVNFGDKDITETVTYHNNAQKAVITYVDDMTKKTLASDSQDGKFDHEITFEHDPAEVINSLKEKGYKLVSNNFKDGTKYKADDKQNEFIVHLTHDTQKVNRQDQVIETIHYVYENGSKSQPDHEQTISFTEDGIKDRVTGQITWTSATPQKFDDVTTPTIVGYTPDKGNVTGSTVNFGDKDIEVTVTYHNNAQTAKITYIDDTAKKTLASDSQNGKFDHEITFEHDPANVIKGLEAKGYKLVSNNFNNNNYQADNSKNVFYVHFVHGSHAISDKKAITETIIYRMSDGSKAPDQVEKQVEFSRDGYNDEVTKQDHWNKWQPNKQSFSAVPTPEVTGYTPDIKSVEAKTVTAGDKDIAVTVTYTPDKQKAKVVFIDDTAKKTLDTHDLTGVTNGHEKYSPSEEIEKFIHDNYVFVSSNYPEKGFTYDNDDNHDQVFEVHLKEIPTESDTPIVPGNTEDNGGSNDTPTDSDNPEKDNGESDTGKSSHKTPVKRNSNKKHHGTKKTNTQKNAKKTNIQKTSKTAKLNPNRLAQPKLDKVQESTNSVNRIKHDALPQTGEKHSSLMAMLGLAISGLGMIGAMKSKKRKDD